MSVPCFAGKLGLKGESMCLKATKKTKFKDRSFFFLMCKLKMINIIYASMVFLHAHLFHHGGRCGYLSDP